MYKLVIADDEGSKSTVPVVRDEITIGRKEGNTIRLTERNVSRRHAKVVRNNGRIFIEDVAARYGIRKNGARIDQRAEFAPGDVVTIGDYTLTLKAEKQKKPPEKPSPPARPEKPQPKKPPQKREEEPTQVLPAMPAKLVVISSNFAGQEFPLNRKEQVIGRGEDCDIIIDHRSVSQKHAKILRETGGKYQIVDLNSKNGVSIGGEKYRAVHLKRGDVIELGHVKFRFVAPGENYVFTPKPQLEQTPSSNKSSGRLAIAAVVVALVLAGTGAFVAIGPNGEEDGQDRADDSPRAEADDQQAPPDKKEELAGDSEDDDTERVDKVLDKARERIDGGRLDKAVAELESAREYLKPNDDQDARIDELLSEVKAEKPFERHYEAARDEIAREDYDEALERLDEIPSHSIFEDLYRDEQLAEDALGGLMDRAEDALAKEKMKEARKFAEQALDYDSEYEPADTLVERLDEAEEEGKEDALADSSGAASDDSAPSTGTASGSSGGSGGGSNDQAKPAPNNDASGSSGGSGGGLSAAEAKTLYSNAQKKIFQNKPDGAIADCKKALAAGHSACHRILGIAYKKKGNKSLACDHFQKYLDTSPGNPGAVEREMDKLECE